MLLQAPSGLSIDVRGHPYSVNAAGLCGTSRERLMLKQVTFLGAAAIAATLATSATAQDLTADTVVATVGDTEITMGEVIIAQINLPAEYRQFPPEVLFNGLIDQLVQQQLLADTLEAASKRTEYALVNERRSLEAAEVITDIADNAVTEADLLAVYEERFTNAEDIPEYRASHLLVETQEEANAAKERLNNGEAFADVARDVSTGPTGPGGGDLGWFGAGAMVQEFENQITSLEVGGISDPFETQFGWHIANLTDTRAQPKPTLEDVRRQLAGELQEAAITARLEELAANAAITIPEEGDFDVNAIFNTELLDE